MGSGFGGLDFSHEGAKRVVGLLVGFVFAIARAACSFLYLNNEYIIRKEKKKTTKRLDKLLALFFPPPTFHIQLNTLPRFACGTNPSRTALRSP